MLATMVSVEKLDGLYELEGGMDVVLRRLDHARAAELLRKYLRLVLKKH